MKIQEKKYNWEVVRQALRTINRVPDLQSSLVIWHFSGCICETQQPRVAAVCQSPQLVTSSSDFPILADKWQLETAENHTQTTAQNFTHTKIHFFLLAKDISLELQPFPRPWRPLYSLLPCTISDEPAVSADQREAVNGAM